MLLAPDDIDLIPQSVSESEEPQGEKLSNGNLQIPIVSKTNGELLKYSLMLLMKHKYNANKILACYKKSRDSSASRNQFVCNFN